MGNKINFHLYLCLLINNNKINILIKKKTPKYLYPNTCFKINKKKIYYKVNNVNLLNLLYSNSVSNLVDKKHNSIDTKWLLKLYLKNISYYYLNINMSWRFVNIINTVNKDFLNKLWYKIYKKKFFGILYGKKKKTITWFLQLYKLKDPQGLIFIIQKLLIKANLKKHRRFFFLVGAFFKILFLVKEKKNSLQGCSLFFKGKLGKKGSVRKSKFFVKYGLGSFTNKNLRVNYKTYVIITITGVVGCNISLFYQ